MRAGRLEEVMPEDDKAEGAQVATEAKPEPSDVDKLRSTYDRKLADANKQLQSERQERASLELALAQAKSASEFKPPPEDTEPQELIAQLKQAHADVTASKSELNQYKAQAWPLVVKGWAAEHILTSEQKDILSLAAEELEKASSSADFERIFNDVQARWTRLADALGKKPDDGAPSRKPEVDGGRTAARRDYVSELRSLDPFDPEDRKKFEKIARPSAKGA